MKKQAGAIFLAIGLILVFAGMRVEGWLAVQWLGALLVGFGVAAMLRRR